MSGPYSDFDLNPKGNEPEGEDPQGKTPHGANPQGGSPQGVGPLGYGPNGIAFTGDDAQAAEKTKSKLLWVVIALFLALIVVAAIIFGMILPNSSWFGNSDDVAYVGASENPTQTSAAEKRTRTKSSTTTVTTTKLRTTSTKFSTRPKAASGGRCAPGRFDEISSNPSVSHDWDVMYCDGEWAFVGQPNSDAYTVAKWSNGRWIRKDYSTADSGAPVPCYDPERMNQDGVPMELQRKIPRVCPEKTSSTSSSSESTSSSTSTTETTYSSETSEPTAETGTTEMDEPAAGEVDSSL